MTTFMTTIQKRGMVSLALIMITAFIPAMIFANGNQEAATAPGYFPRSGDAAAVQQGFGMGGVHVLEVAADSPAEMAGILSGDMIIAVNGEYSQLALYNGSLDGLSPGDTVTLNIVRQRTDSSEYLTPEEVIVELRLGTSSEGQPYLGLSYTAGGYMSPRGGNFHGMMGGRGFRNTGNWGAPRVDIQQPETNRR